MLLATEAKTTRASYSAAVLYYADIMDVVIIALNQSREST